MKKIWEKILSFISKNRVLPIIITVVFVIIIIMLISALSFCNGNPEETTIPITTENPTQSMTTTAPTTDGITTVSTSVITTGVSNTTTPLTTVDVTTTAEPMTTIVTPIIISFNASGGTAVASESISPGSSITISNKTTTFTNYNFLGWFTSPNGQGTQVLDTTVFNISQTLYAAWELMPLITITFNTNGGDGIDPVSFYSSAGENQTINQVPTKNGYAFNGWYDNAELTGQTITGTIFVSQNMTLYAKWSVDTSHLTYEESYDQYSGISGYYITSVSDTYSGTELIFPAEIDGNPIIGINSGVAGTSGINKATKIIFEEGYQVIGAHALNTWNIQTTLTEVVLPASIKYIGSYAFNNQTGLTSVNLSNCINLLGIDQYAFKSTALTEITLPDSLNHLGQGVFEDVSSLTLFNFPSITHYLALPPRFLYNTPNLTDIAIPDTIKSIGYWAFANSGIESITIPESLTHINEEAFKGSQLETVIFENEANIVYIKNNAFKDTPYFNTYSQDFLIINNMLIKYFGDGTNVVIPNEVVAISEGAFAGITIQNITFNANLKEIRPYAFHETTFTNAITLPDQIRLIGRYAFNYATFSGQVLTLPSNLLTLGESAFEASYHLAGIVFQAGTPLKIIPQRAFHVVSDLASITLHDGLEVIGDEAFVGNPITAIAIPATVSELGYEAFRGCTNLSTVTFADASNLEDLETNPFLSTPWLNNHPDDYVMIDRFLIRYKGASSDVLIPANVEVIVTLAIQTLPVSITSIDLGSVVKIHEYGISGYHPDLTSVHLPATLKYLGNSAISSSADSITSITWDAGFNPTFVSNFAFGMGAPYAVFQEVTADNLVIFGDYLYLGTQATGVITVPEGIKIIGTYAFRDADVTEVVLPSTLEEIQERAFDNSAITTITIPQNVNTIGNQAFSNAAMLQSVTFLDSSAIEHVGNDPFYNSPVKHNYITPEGFFVIGDVLFGLEGVFDTVSMPVGIHVFALKLYSPVNANNFVIPANVMVAIDYFYPGESVVTLDFAGYFPNNEYRAVFFGGFYDPEIVIPDLVTLVLPTDVYTSCHYIREITTDIAFNDIAFYFDFYHPSVVALD